MSDKTYGSEDECGYGECTNEADWHRLTDDIGPGLVYVCEAHRRIECDNATGMAIESHLGTRYTKIDRPPGESTAVIAHLVAQLKQVSHA